MSEDALATADASPVKRSKVGLIFLEMFSISSDISARSNEQSAISSVYEPISAIIPAILSRSSSLSLMYFIASLTSAGSYSISSPPKILEIVSIILFTGSRSVAIVSVNASMMPFTPSNDSSITSDNPLKLSFTAPPTSSITSAIPLRTSDTP